ncbi:MAG: Ig-like domain-containing protein [Demequina sp.]|nr:Ig-like domain-containing protein [Demequina sp.]
MVNLAVLDKSPIKLKLNQTQLRIVKGSHIRLYDGLYFRDVLPASYSGKVTWKSSNTKVAVVSSDGLVTAKKAGSATITVTSKSAASNGKKLTVSIKISVVSKASKTKMTKLTASVPRTMKLGAVSYITGTYQPSTVTNVSVTYSSANPKVVTVDAAGRLVAKGTGTTQISVKAKGKTVKYTITVS